MSYFMQGKKKTLEKKYDIKRDVKNKASSLKSPLTTFIPVFKSVIT